MNEQLGGWVRLSCSKQHCWVPSSSVVTERGYKRSRNCHLCPHVAPSLLRTLIKTHAGEPWEERRLPITIGLRIILRFSMYYNILHLILLGPHHNSVKYNHRLLQLERTLEIIHWPNPLIEEVGTEAWVCEVLCPGPPGKQSCRNWSPGLLAPSLSSFLHVQSCVTGSRSQTH